MDKSTKKDTDRSMVFVEPLEYKIWCLKQCPNITNDDICDQDFKSNNSNLAKDVSISALNYCGYIWDIDYDKTIQILQNTSTIENPTWIIRNSSFNRDTISNIDVLVIATFHPNLTPNVVQYRFINIQGVGWYPFTKKTELNIDKSLKNDVRKNHGLIKHIVWNFEQNRAIRPSWVCIYDLLQYFIGVGFQLKNLIKTPFGEPRC